VIRSRIVGTGRAVPSKKLTNDDLAKMVDTSDSWIVERTGIRERHILDPSLAASDLATEAGEKACRAAGIDPSAVDCIIVGTVTGDCPFPATATFVQKKMGAKLGGCAFDLSAACAGFLYGVSIADSFIRTGQFKNVLIVGVEVLSRIVDWTDRATCVLFGDGAGAVVIAPSQERDFGILDYEAEIDGSGGPALCMPAGGSLRPASQDTVAERLHFVKQDGQAVFRFAVRKTEEMCRRLLERNRLQPGDIDLMVSHQANRRIILSAAERLGFPSEKVVINIDRYGNTTGATIPLALADAVADGRLKKGSLVLLTSVGAGFTVGALLLRWGF